MSEFLINSDGDVWAYIPRFDSCECLGMSKREEAFNGLLNALEQNEDDETIGKFIEDMKKAPK